MNTLFPFVAFALLATAVHAANPPTIQSVQPAPGTVTVLTQVTVTFSKTVTNVVATDLRANEDPADAVSGSGATYTFTLARQPEYGAVQIVWDPGHGIRDQDTPPNRFDETGAGATWQYTFIDVAPPLMARRTPQEGVSVRTLTELEVLFSEGVSGVDAGDLLINGVPANSLAVVGVGRYRFTFPQPPAGLVQVGWAPNHGITDLAPTPNAFAGGSWTYTLDPNLGLPSIRINELLAANVSGLTDEDGEPQDWIELWNYGSTVVNLGGYSLSDDAEDPGRWTFPATNLAPGQFLVVFASEKDRRAPTNATHRLHTNFKLSPGGEYLGLFNAELPRVKISDFGTAYPEQRNNYSYGIDGSGLPKYFATPTPGLANGVSAIAGFVPPPHFNVSRGYFNAPFTLLLTTTMPGATIRYTTDGSEPTLTNGLSYSASVTISNTAIVRAAGFKNDVLPSVTVTHTYLFLDQIIQQPDRPAGFPTNWGANSGFAGGVVPADYAMDMDPLRVDVNNPASAIDPAKLQRLKDGLRELPSVSVVLKLDDIFGTNGLYQKSAVETGTPGTKPENKKACSVEMILPGGETAFTTTCGIDLHGNASRNPLKNPKHGFKLNFRGDFGPSTLSYRLFEDSPVTEYDDVLLRADFNSSWRHWSDTTGQALGALQRTRATRTRDAWMKDAMREMGGVASHNRFVHLYLNGLYWGVFEFSEDPTEVFAKNALGGTTADYDIVDQGVAKGGTLNFYNTMISLPTPNTLAQYDQYSQYLNVPDFIDYMLLHFYMGHQDWATTVTKNWYAIRKRVPGAEGTFRYVPWDGECILLSEDVNRVTVSTPPSGLHTKLVSSPEYRLAFADRIHRQMIAPGAALTPDVNITRWQKWQAVLDKAIVAESARWGDYRRDVHQYSEGTYQLYTREGHWVPENTRMLGYFANRGATVLSQLRAANLYPAVSAPVFNQQGGGVPRGFNLTMAATNTILYTLDGTDPRVYGTGAVSPGASAYASPLTLSSSLLVKARALSGTNWSALNEGTFVVDPLASPLRITEIMYNPVGGDAYEFLELQNVSGLPLNVGSWSIDGAGYVFPPSTVLGVGQIIVLGSDVNSGNWATRYPLATAFGRFSGKLDNGGEKLSIVDDVGRLWWSVEYDDQDGWPTAADGLGASLENINLFGDPNNPAHWRASAGFNGTPGSPAAPPASGAVVLNEIMAENISAVPNGGFYSDWIELRNTTGAPLNLAEWSLSDDSNPRKFVFPAGTTIAASGYLGVWCDTNALVPGLRAGFGLGRNGDAVLLYDASTNRVDALGFGVQLPNLSVGRVGTEWTLTQPTPNAANTAVPLGAPASLSINEWLADAPPGGDDWIELYNASGSPVALRGLYLGTTADTHPFTALSFIAAGGFLQLLADENPGANHVNFRLPALGDSIILYDSTGAELGRVDYGPQAQAVTQGRLPDGGATVASFPASASPGSSNYLLTYNGPILNEVLAINRTAVLNGAGRTPDFVELRNPAGTPFDLSGMRLSNDPEDPAQWTFPTGTIIPANGYLVVWFDEDQAASTGGPVLNTGRALDGESGEVWLFNIAGQSVDSVVYGFQVADRSIGRDGSSWSLSSSVTPGSANAAPAALGAVTALRLNEWMANSPDGDDWFEIYNSATLPVDLAGVFVTDSPAVTALTQSVLPPLSFIGPRGFAVCRADGHPSDGRNHVSFSLDGDGEMLRLLTPALSVIDTVYFGLQPSGVSQGRLPDGGAGVVNFPESATPAESNYVPISNAVVNEVLAHADAPLEDSIELYNPGQVGLDISGWYLSDSQSEFRKYQIPGGTVIPANGYRVFTASQFNGGAGSLVPFTLDSSRGGEAWLSAVDGGGNLTGYRSGAKFGASANGVSFGRYLNSQATAQFVAQTARTPSSANASPSVGPIVINEIMYHPPDVGGTNDNVADEYIELANISTQTAPLFDPNAATNTWRLRGSVSFNFPGGVNLAARGTLLVVSFDPAAEPAARAAFQSRYSLPPGVTLVGPYRGKLGNSGGTVSLLRPDLPLSSGPDAGFVPYLSADQVDFDDAWPWSGEPDGNGTSLQRHRPYSYGNDPANWGSDGPTPGRPNVPGSSYVDADADGISDQWEAANGLSSANPADANADPDGDGRTSWQEFLDGTNPQSAASVLAPPVITQAPVNQSAVLGSSVIFSVTASGTAPFHYQWRFNGMVLPEAQSATLAFNHVDEYVAGDYSVLVWNAAGFALSPPAHLTINIPPAILVSPQSQTVNTNSSATFTVVATGTGVLRYQWQFNNANIPDATNAALTVTGTGLAHEGDYRVLVTDDISTVSSAVAHLTVRVPPVILIAPRSQTNVVGSSMTFSVTCSGSVPMGFQWRKGSAGVPGIGNNGWLLLNTTNSSITLVNLQTSDSALYRVVVTNSGNAFSTVNASWNVLILAPPAITNPPATQVVAAGTNVTFTVGVSGSAPFAYQWYFQNNPLPNATNATLSLTNVQAGDTGNYHVVVTNLVGTATSPSATLALLGQLSLLEPEWLANAAAFRFKLQGSARTYAIEVSTNLQNWTTLTNLPSPGGVVPVTDTTVGGTPRRYYRARELP